jgi:hypothetical protein
MRKQLKEFIETGNWDRSHIEEAKRTVQFYKDTEKQYKKEAGVMFWRVRMEMKEELEFCIDYFERKLNET